MKHYIILWFVLLFLITACDYDSSKKMPVTSNSQEAIEWYWKGFKMEDKEDIKGAEQAYYKALELDSSFALAHLRIAMVRDDFDRRSHHIAKAMNNREEISAGEQLLIEARNDFYGTPTEDGMEEFDYAQELIDLYPEDEYANYLFGYLHIHHGKEDPKMAIRYFTKAIDINPEFIKPYNDLAYAHMDLKEYEKAEQIIKQYISLLPDKANPYDTYADLLMKQSRYEESITAYHRVLEIDASYPWAIMGIAGNLNFLDRHHKSREFLGRLETIALSDYEDRHKWRARFTSYIDEGNLDSAIVVLNIQNETAKLNQENTQVYFSYRRSIRLMLEAGYTNEALETFGEWERFVESEYTNDNIIQNVKNLMHYYTAFAHFKNSDPDRAIELLDTHYPDASDQVSLLKARILMSKGDLERAQNILTKIDHNDPWNRYWYARVLELRGNGDLAQNQYDAILELNMINEVDFSLARASVLNRI